MSKIVNEHATPDQHPDDAAVDRFAASMKAKLAKSRAKGRSGLEDGSYHLEADELEQVIKRAVEPYADTLRSLASYVGAGGYNAPTVDPSEFEAKVRWGIDSMIQAQSAPAGEREPYEDGTPNPCKTLRWAGNNAEDDFPAGTKLYALPPAKADEVSVPVELLEQVLNVMDNYVTHETREEDQLRAILASHQRGEA